MNANYYKLILKLFHISYGHNLSLKGCPRIFAKRGSNITIGNNVLFKSTFHARTALGAYDNTAYIKIGDDVTIEGATIYAKKGISVGSGTVIEESSKVLDNDSFSPEIEKSNTLFTDEIRKEFTASKEISIGKNCFIGCNSLILKGTVLGDNCVVSAGAVVSGEFQPNSVIAGNPGKVIRML